jgi:hypothetical protein
MADAENSESRRRRIPWVQLRGLFEVSITVHFLLLCPRGCIDG